MYIRPVHAELDPKVLHDFISQYSFGLLITHVPHPDPVISALQATHIPWVIDPPPAGFESLGVLEPGKGAEPGVRGKLRGHMARANPHTKAFLDHLATASQSQTSSSGGILSSLWGSRPAAASGETVSVVETGTVDEEVLIIFQAPTHSYVTPKFYTSTKPNTGKVVPTWDFAAVQVYGRLKVYNKGEESSNFLQQQVEDLTNHNEQQHASKKAASTGQAEEKTWEVAESPVSYVELLKKGIIGLEVEITRIEGRFKLSQESPQGDWDGVVEGFKGLRTEAGDRMAEMIESQGKGRTRGETKKDLPENEGKDNELSQRSAQMAAVCPVKH